MLSLFGWTMSIRISKPKTPLMVNEALRNRLFRTYSQFGEDMYLAQLFEGNTNGCYIDIGANHPVKLSNTKKFYDKGWSGINVEPNPQLHRQLCEQRTRDININCGVSDQPGVITFFEIDPHPYSTFDKEVAKATRFSSSRKLIRELPIEVVTINDIFLKAGRPVDFLSLDTESYDYKVLVANDWNRHRPKAIIVELNHIEARTVHDLLQRQHYHLVLFNGTNGIFVEDTFAQGFR